MNPEREIAALAEHGGRAAGTDAERRAANHLRNRLQSLGRDAVTEPTEIWPRALLAQALYALVAVTGSLVSVSNPALGASLLLVAAVMAALDLGGVMWPARVLTGRRASQNVTSREGGDKPGVVVVLAHYDAGGEAGTLARLTRLVGDPGALVLGSMLFLLACCAARVAGIEDVALSAVQLVPTVVLVVLVVPLVETELAEPSSRSEDNTTACITALWLAEQLGGGLRYFDLWVVFTGARRPFARGTIEWVRRHRKELEGRRTFLVGLEGSEADGPLFSRRHGPVVPLACDAELVELCRTVVEDGLEAREVILRESVDAAAATARGVRAVTVACPTRDSIEGSAAFCRELVGRIDADLGPRSAPG